MGSHRVAPRPSRRTGGISPTALAATALAFLFMAVLSGAPASAAAGTYIRLAQLTPDQAGAQLVLSSVSAPKRSVTIPGTQYGKLSEYRLIEPGDYVVSIQPTGPDGSAQSVTQTLNAMAGNAYTLAAVGGAMPGGLSVLTDDLALPDAGNAKVRVIDATPPGPPIDVRGPAGSFAQGLGRGQASGYLMFPAGPTTLTISAAGRPDVDVPITAKANQVATVVLVDRAGTVAADLMVDAEGPTAVPPGSIKAGFGGAAPGRMVGVITFGALAVGAAALSGLLSLRNRSARRLPC